MKTNVDRILNSIAITVSDPSHCSARKSDCHFATATYIRKRANETDIIVLIGGDDGNVYHSVVTDSKFNIVSDSLKNGRLDTREMTYTANAINGKSHILKVVKIVPVSTFKRFFIDDNPVSFKEFLAVH